MLMLEIRARSALPKLTGRWETPAASIVGAGGFEPPTPCTPCKCATGLRYAPNMSDYSAPRGFLQGT